MIGNLRPLTVGPFTLVDVLTISDLVERERVLAQGRRHLLDLIRKTRTTRLCTPDVFNQRISEAWKELATRNPRADWIEFSTTFDAELDDSECDPRLSELAFAIYRGDLADRNLLGVFYLYNVEVIRSSETELEITAYPAPGIPFVNDVEWSDQVRSFLKKALEFDFIQEDGILVKLLAWKFPTREGHAWAGEPWAERLVSSLVADGFPRTDSDGKLREFSRRPAR